MTSERTAQVRLTATEADTASSMRSGDVPVLATPRVIALCEEAAGAAVAGMLEAGSTSVGTWIEVEHLAPSPIGAEVIAAANVEVGRRPDQMGGHEGRSEVSMTGDIAVRYHELGSGVPGPDSARRRG